MRSAAPGSSTSTTARSHASGSRPVTAPAPSTTAASLERNTRSRASRKTRLVSDRLHGHDRPGGRRAVPHVAQRGLPGDHQDGLARRWLVEPLEGEEGRGADPAQHGQRREGAVVEHDAGLEVGAVATPFERNALAQRVDVAPKGVRHGLGAHLDQHHPIEVRRRDLPQEPLDELPEVIEPHRQYVGRGEWYPTVCTPPTACIDRYHSPLPTPFSP